ncbi:MAG TPA: hypothetical protein VL588_10455, partial [Bdellovibrionota bacterium]|nr:hypothetical protein [Bdellovibrionota bacterium]
FVDEDFVPEMGPPPDLTKLAVALCRALADGALGPPKRPVHAGAKVFSLKKIKSPTAPADGSPVEAAATEEARWFCGDRWVRESDATPLRWAQGPTVWEEKDRPGVSGVLTAAKGNIRVCAFPDGPDRWVVRMGGWVLSVRRRAPRLNREGKLFRLSALVKGRVHAILFRKGAEVPAHEALAVVDSLRVLVPHALPAKARVLQWHVRAEDEVQWGQDLADVELLE